MLIPTTFNVWAEKEGPAEDTEVSILRQRKKKNTSEVCSHID